MLTPAPIYISTGLRENKFGVDVASARDLYHFADESQFLEPVGIDCHIGSQILDVARLLPLFMAC